ncbi:MAG: PleD family two-component system response regulator [Rhizobiaceae bacterium]|nr:PleD family two-component system response regulator [Rhizobiaceae bacterium]
MTARVLVVDDVATNIRLLEARLMAEYFQVLTAANGKDALQICRSGQADVVLLDVMMPEMDGFEVCRQLKSDPATMHIPVVMVTALDSQEDKLQGLEAGADDFLTKPVDDFSLVTRVKSLARLKMTTDDLRLRAQNGDELAIENFTSMEKLKSAASSGRIGIVDDVMASNSDTIRFLSQINDVELISNPHDALIKIASDQYDLILMSMYLDGADSLRMCSHLRTIENTRNIPIIGIANSGGEETLSRALEIGLNDFVHRPIDLAELAARIRTQLIRKRYNDCLRSSVQQTIEMAVKDALTGLHNRRYFETQFQILFDKAHATNKPLSVVMCDIDHFKSVNDTFGHDVGDNVIRDCAERINNSVRKNDLVCRFGGEEFVILMPETSERMAALVSERIRETISLEPVSANSADEEGVSITMSFGVSTIEFGSEDSKEKLLRRADLALYNAKRGGRNRVASLAA